MTLVSCACVDCLTTFIRSSPFFFFTIQVALPALLAYKKAEATKQLLPVKFKGTFLEGLFPELTDEEQDAVFAPMHEYWAPKMREKFLELRGFYLKNGQMIVRVFESIHAESSLPFPPPAPPSLSSQLCSLLNLESFSLFPFFILLSAINRVLRSFASLSPPSPPPHTILITGLKHWRNVPEAVEGRNAAVVGRSAFETDGSDAAHH